MAILDLSNATRLVDMTDPNLVAFGAVDTATPTIWSWLNAAGHDLQLDGSGMTFNAQGRALSGTVKSIGIDLGNDDFANPDVLITGINVSATTLDGGAGTFWRFLEGDDTVVGPNLNGNIFHQIFGDGVAARAGASVGGNDTIHSGAASSLIFGDVVTVGSLTAGTPAVTFKGGDDTIFGGATEDYQGLVGDARYVHATGTLTGGNDTIFTQTERIGSETVGDALVVEGIKGDLATVIGGHDHISAGGRTAAYLVGDVFVQKAYSFVRGGNDTINGSSFIGSGTEDIVGDVVNVGDNEMIGGHDEIWGNAGNDYIYGDFRDIGALGRVTGGNDIIYGGDGDDRIHGEGPDQTKTIGGDDRLFGEAGNDIIVGETGNDLLDGGSGSDLLVGGLGNDVYVVDTKLDQVLEEVGAGIDTVRTTAGIPLLMDNVEHLTFIGKGAFTGAGNGLDNTIRGGAGADDLDGKGGNDSLFGGAGGDYLFGDLGDDILNGGAGADTFTGGEGFDTLSYAGSEQAVRIALDGSLAATGDALGDVFFTVEALEGTNFGDTLRGDAGDNWISGGDGSDKLAGGAGRDAFIFSAALGAGNVDRISDFIVADDTIRLDDAVFKAFAGSTGVILAGQFRANATGLAQDSTDRIIYESDTGELFYDADGVGGAGAVEFATVKVGLGLTSADFLVF